MIRRPSGFLILIAVVVFVIYVAAVLEGLSWIGLPFQFLPQGARI